MFKLTCYLLLAIVAISNYSFAEEYTEQYIIDKLKLPEEPDEEENNSTPTGVDKNENYIRDNVERKIAFEHYPDLQKIKLLNDYAAEYTKQIIHFSDGNEVVYLKSRRSQIEALGCMAFLYKEEGVLQLATIKRLLNEGANRGANAHKRTGFGSKKMNLLTYTEMKEICPNYK